MPSRSPFSGLIDAKPRLEVFVCVLMLVSPSRPKLLSDDPFHLGQPQPTRRK